MTDFIKALFIVLSTFFIPIHGILIALTYVIIFDLMTGLLASWRTNSVISFHRMKQIIPKIIIYNLTIAGVYLLDIHLLQEFTNYLTDIEFLSTKIIGTAIFLVEFSSVIRNIENSFNVKFFRLFQRWKVIIGKEASDVSKITGDMSDSVTNIRNMSKDPENRAHQNHNYRGRSLRYGRGKRNEQSDSGNMPI